MSHADVTVRQFLPGEWQAYKAVRLKALQSDRGVFGSSYEKEAACPDQQWQERVTEPDIGIFGVFYDGNVIGMTGIFLDKSNPEPSAAVLWGSWLEKKWRGKGISKKMYAARLQWAKQYPSVRGVFASTRESNLASKKAMQRHGFLFTRAEDNIWQDGQSEPQHFYELRL